MERTTDRDAIAELARRLDCLTESELRTLADATEGTVEAWRKRGTGPAHTIIGRTILYPREAVHEFLRARVKVRGRIAAKDVL